MTTSDADRAALMDPKEFGSKLFEAVIDGRVQDVLRKSEGVDTRTNGQDQGAGDREPACTVPPRRARSLPTIPQSAMLFSGRRSRR
jgi:hypothetical protein